jgi:hypothetical protein
LQVLSEQGHAVWRLAPAVLSRVGKTAMSVMGEHEHQHHGMMMNAAENQDERYFDAAGHLIAGGAAQHAAQLACEFSGLPLSQVMAVTQVTRFEGEYGFLNKRLPVWRVAFATPDHRAVFVENASGVVAADVDDAQRLEGFSFAYLHKGHWRDAVGKDVRDSVLTLFALLNVAMVVLGLSLWVRRYR